MSREKTLSIEGGRIQAAVNAWQRCCTFTTIRTDNCVNRECGLMIVERIERIKGARPAEHPIQDCQVSSGSVSLPIAFDTIKLNQI